MKTGTVTEVILHYIRDTRILKGKGFIAREDTEDGMEGGEIYFPPVFGFNPEVSDKLEWSDDSKFTDGEYAPRHFFFGNVTARDSSGNVAHFGYGIG